MNPNPYANRQVSHEEAVKRFLRQLNGDPQAKPIAARVWRSASEPMVTPEAAEELARWFSK
jgi:hypothetical protein